ncbi:MAG TPA: bifunctional glycosyltransferase family 2/GtrA family protein, partial [Gammaproteobacteria bacterium]|nr:bifunctional glycosyltransferase family 2/GtrA family protein [Gammaproteobacteria bacterium]
IKLMQELTQFTEKYHIIIVNDGSTGKSRDIIEEVSSYPNVTIIHHAVNMGKGQALKTAFQHYLAHFSDQSAGVVTADADGQHSPDDIQKIAASLPQANNGILLGSRQFDTKTPLRSRLGNSISAKIFQLIMRKSLRDTQTGLRGISRSLIKNLSEISGSCYEYELNMLVYAIKNKITITEIPIKTIYLDDNKSSHFNPLIDSLKVYFVFFRYILGSLSSAGVDFLFFTLFYFFTHHLFFSVAGSRVISGTFNFILCKSIIFKSKDNFMPEFIKYISLAVFSMLLSYVLIDALTKNHLLNVYYGKLIADVCIFMMNFTIQRLFIFSLKKQA